MTITKRLLAFLSLLSLVCGATVLSSIGVEAQIGRQMIFDLEYKMTCFYETVEKEMIMKLTLQPYPRLRSRFPLQLRLTSPSGEFSEWENGDGEVRMTHNVTEDGDYEICVNTPRPLRVALNIFFHNPEKVEKSFQEYLNSHQLSNSIQESTSQMFQHLYNIKYSIKFYNQITVRDQSMQELNGEHIKAYSIVFCSSAVFLSLLQVVLIRRMFRTNTKRIRI